MTPKENQLFAKADMTNVTLLRVLLMFLESKGLLKHEEFIDYLDLFLASIDPNDDPEMQTIFRMKVESLRDPTPASRLN